jgi:hypothetical protein
MTMWAIKLTCFMWAVLTVLTVTGCIHADIGTMR